MRLFSFLGSDALESVGISGDGNKIEKHKIYSILPPPTPATPWLGPDAAHHHAQTGVLDGEIVLINSVFHRIYDLPSVCRRNHVHVFLLPNFITVKARAFSFFHNLTNKSH